MNLPKPVAQYDQQNEAQTRTLLARADAQNQKKGADVVLKDNRLILTSPNGTQWAASISNSGVLTWTAL